MPKDDVYHLSDLEEDEEEGITFQVQQPLQVEQKPTDPKPVTGIFLPPDTSAGPVTGEKNAWLNSLVTSSTLHPDLLCGN